MNSTHIAGFTLQLYWHWTIHELNQKHLYRKIHVALTWLGPIYYDDNGYGYDDKDGNDRKDDNPEIENKTELCIYLRTQDHSGIHVSNTIVRRTICTIAIFLA